MDEPEAKASMIWIIGEYADRIDNAPELLESFVEHFEEENTQVCSTPIFSYHIFIVLSYHRYHHHIIISHHDI